MLNYGGNDCLLPFFFLLPHVKFIKIPSSTSWQRGGKSLAENQNFKAGLLRLAAARDSGFPNITNLHIGNGVRDLWDQTCMWSLISACTNLEILYLERPGGSVQSLIPADPFTADPDEMSFVRHQIHFPNLVDLDIAHSELSSYDFGNMMQSCTRLRHVSVVQFQPASALSFHARDVSPGPARIIECLAASAATLEKLSVSWAHKDFSRTFNFRPEIMVLIKPMRGFSALRLLELSYKDLEKGEEGVLVNLIKDCDKLEAFKLIGVTNMPRRELYHFASHVKEGVFPRLQMLKLCTNIKDSSAWAALKSIADHEIVSLLAAGQVKLVLRPHHRKPGDPRFPELNFKGDDGEPTAPDASSA
ncbi:hypothetical protein B0T18DRAFT_468741 [Schizothecium vesticola]|uniref:Uncharacterized protein n=1 Tax=Schizothecium vesticola TaxID=314040 RepID=A0AA40EQ62_9PEZI|nr:hypothetical protein B0T18DRAFT_468741 [Schizothecium vesticola]